MLKTLFKKIVYIFFFNYWHWKLDYRDLQTMKVGERAEKLNMCKRSYCEFVFFCVFFFQIGSSLDSTHKTHKVSSTMVRCSSCCANHLDIGGVHQGNEIKLLIHTSK